MIPSTGLDWMDSKERGVVVRKTRTRIVALRLSRHWPRRGKRTCYPLDSHEASFLPRDIFPKWKHNHCQGGSAHVTIDSRQVNSATNMLCIRNALLLHHLSCMAEIKPRLTLSLSIEDGTRFRGYVHHVGTPSTRVHRNCPCIEEKGEREEA